MDPTIAEIQRGLQRLYNLGVPGQAGPRGAATVRDVTLLGSGFEADVFAFSVEAGGDATGGHAAGEHRDLILRLYTGQDVVEKAAREFAAMRRLREAGYPVPEVSVFRPRFSPLEHPGLIMERIHGASLGLSYWAVPEAGRREAQAVLSGLMAGLHALDGGVILPDSPLVDPQSPYDSVDHELSSLSALLGQLGGREPASLREAFAWLVARRSGVPCERPGVIHGDFHPNNVLVRADGVPFVIDWSNVRLGDGRVDIAWSRLITQAEAQDDGGVGDLLLYEQLAGETIKGLDYFDVLACTRLLLSVLISLEFGGARQGLRPESDARMRQDASHTRYVAGVLHGRTGIPVSDVEQRLSVL